MFAVRADGMVKPRSRLERNATFATRADETRQIGGCRHPRSATSHLGTEPVSGEGVEPCIERVVERKLHEHIVGEPDERGDVLAVPRLDRVDVRVGPERRIQHCADLARSRGEIAERRRRPDEPPERERVSARTGPRILGECIG